MYKLRSLKNGNICILFQVSNVMGAVKNYEVITKTCAITSAGHVSSVQKLQRCFTTRAINTDVKDIYEHVIRTTLTTVDQ